MIREIYKDINKAFKAKDYSKVVNLVQSIEIPSFGFDQRLLYKYGFSLLKIGKIEEGINVLRIITNLTKFSFIEQNIINSYEKEQNIDLSFDKSSIASGVVVNVSSIPILIWKVVNNKVYGFKIENNEHGIHLAGKDYSINGDLAFNPSLVIFNIKDIDSISFKLDNFNYRKVITDLYERNCIFGNIANTPKNIFIKEMESSLNIGVGDIITVFDDITRHNRFYYIISFVEKSREYKVVAITHEQGNLRLKNSEITNISFDAYISGKNIISLDYKKQLAEEIASLDRSILLR